MALHVDRVEGAVIALQAVTEGALSSVQLRRFFGCRQLRPVACPAHQAEKTESAVGGRVELVPGQRIDRHQVVLSGQRVTNEETLVKGLGRVRDLRQGPDGLIYLAIDTDQDNPGVVRLEPVGGR